ncbi:hypothetical protein EST38_g8402 [Candolleomyces aberdarensis]|uniref:Protein kinase domain-containing protein n=1 Tax=Candolleomyces aberdarensis TaxID=2316362 RepID=A0A4Q2DER2_9AGAR|nr:hypothetical protein EST38_g8402 [Candolleomyces aberdarensis]
MKKYLGGGREYHNGRWTRIPDAPSTASELHGPMCRIINSLIQHSGLSETSNARTALIGHFQRETTGGPEKSPMIAIKAIGPSFSSPKGSPLAFSNIASFFDASLDSEADAWTHLAQMSDCVKHIFTQQPNRRFFRSLLITEKKVQLFHFDRSGAQYSPPLNIHDHPEAFIRLVLGLTATDERILGLDDSIQWSTAPNGTRTAGSLKTIDCDSAVVTYDLVMGEGPIIRSGLLGRGTTCWVVRNERGEKFIVKDYWVSDDRISSESELLEEVKGLKGVCQMVSYEDNRAQTLDFRGNTSTFEEGVFQNRTSVRIVMKAHGRSLENFTSMEQVLGALRDAIAAHKALLSRHIIHRDISPNNILLGQDAAKEGLRGILIDLDIALKVSGLASDAHVDPKVGTRMFQPLIVLRSYEGLAQYVPLYDYLDDLEAFFWVFTYIILAYKPNGDRMLPNPFQERTLGAWIRHFPDAVYASKHIFLSSPTMVYDIREVIDPGWHDIYDDLFLGFRAFMWEEISGVKARLLFMGTTTLPDGSLAPNRFDPVLEKVEDHYARVIGLFDAALKKVGGTYPVSPSTSLSTNSGDAASEFPSVTTSATSIEDAFLVEKGPGSSFDGKAGLSTSCSTPCNCPASTAQPSTPPQRPKRRSEEAELDDESPKESKRRCPPGRRQIGRILGSVYQFCCTLFE